jgi:glutaredoxin
VPIELTLLTKPGCHLCDDARLAVEATVREVVGELGLAATAVGLTELNILEDEALKSRYFEEIPVLLINGKVHNYWRIDPVRFAEAMRVALGEKEA